MEGCEGPYRKDEIIHHQKADHVFMRLILLQESIVNL